MNQELHHIDLESLVRMHQTASFRLQAALLNGATWQEVQDQRELVTELSIAIQRRRSRRTHPAANSGRSAPNQQPGAPTGEAGA
ncbi:hypothetical protein [Flaviaesturariibacter aridisoli]|uniref:Uncharacterized protein n=1 Tax=Flaviaesturariibacter aridisoli TaxID=2545761 RepID=A0A4V2WMT0_9BACT|nr:hypothetical protein [Flaviaesturariibacter aridisoli]TCZ72792.1 hypothetical protein E0486_08400 [Flaviaesturariibacter aridisoli]